MELKINLLNLDLDLKLPILDYLDSYLSLYYFMGESNSLFLLTTRMILDRTTSQNNKTRNIINSTWKLLETIIEYSDLYTLGLLLGESNYLFLLTTRMLFDYKNLKKTMQKNNNILLEEPKTIPYPKILYKKLDNNQNKSNIPDDRLMVYKKICNKPRMNILFKLNLGDKKPDNTKTDSNTLYANMCSILYAPVVLCSAFVFFKT